MLDAGAHSVAGRTGQIGPNAILQLKGPVDTAFGPGAMEDLLARCGVKMPDGDVMIDERDVACVHQGLRRLHPADAPAIARAAGTGTARYIQAHRIPAAARLALRVLPHRISARLLTGAIAAHAWTFCGSGQLRVSHGRTIRFELRDNPIVHGTWAADVQCDWHAAVFQTLYSDLTGHLYSARETKCLAQGDAACVFEVSPG